LKTIKEAKINKGQRVLIRADFDVVVKGDKVSEDFRIRAVLPTVRFILKKGGLIRLLAHLDRPGGKFVSGLSLKRVTGYLEKLFNRRVIFIRNPFAQRIFEKYKDSKEIVLFENIRFWPGEETNDEVFSKNLGRWGDIYINDAFASSHRKHASVVALANLLPSFAGFALEEEVKSLNKILQNPSRPFFAILGGAKLETKLPLIKLFLKIADGVLIGGVLVNPFVVYPEKQKLSEKSGKFRGIKKIRSNHRLYLPSDVVVAKNLNSKGETLAIGEMREDKAIFDIGPETVKSFAALLGKAKTVVWNGPLGLAEKKEFSFGTTGVAKSLSRIKAFKVIGGGDTIAILRKYKILKGFSHISLGGGAMLEFLVGKKLPGIEVLKR